MCANEVKSKTYDLSVDHAQRINESKKEEKGKDENKCEDRFPRIDPAYIHWFWPVY